MKNLTIARIALAVGLTFAAAVASIIVGSQRAAACFEGVDC